MTHHRPLLLASSLFFALTTACSSDGGEASDAGGNDALSSSFHDCASPPCQVGLAAFTGNPGAVPYCPPTRPDLADLRSSSCGTGLVQPSPLATAQCGSLYVYRIVYGFPGDNFRCAYDGSDQLVGAEWNPDSHPQQVAGTLPPQSCVLTDACGEAGDGGAGDAGDAQ